MAQLDLDLMEYSSDALAQAAYVTNGFFINQSDVNTQDLVLGDSGGTDYIHAQSITISDTTTIMDVQIYFGTTTGTPSGQVTCRIETDSSDKPSGSLAHANATKAFTPSASSWNIIDFTDFSLDAGTYWIRLNCDAQSDNNNWGLFRGASANSYTGGHLKYSTNAGTTWTLYDIDLAFRVNLNLLAYSESTIKTQGTYSLKGVATTDALNKTLTRTAAIGDLTSVKNLKFDIYSSRTGSNIKIGLVDVGATTEITPNVLTANTWQTVNWDISAVTDANKNAVTAIVVTMENADSANTFYIDNFNIAQAIDCFGWVS